MKKNIIKLNYSRITLLLIILCACSAVTAQEWIQKESMLQSSLAGAAEYYNGKIYVFGGDADGLGLESHITDYGDSIVQVYDMETNTWSETIPMPTRNWMLGSAVVGDTLYVVGGGWFNGGVNTLYAFDPITETWFERDTMRLKHGVTTACALDGKIYCIGALDSENSVEMYDPATGTWTDKASCSILRAGVASVAAGGKIYLIGGTLNGGDSYAINEAYDPATDTWTTMTPMNHKRFGVVAAAAGKWIVTMGGTVNSATPSPGIVEVYDIEGDVWYSNNDSLTVPTQWAASCDNDTIAYLLGGEDKCCLGWPPGTENGAIILDIFYEYDLSSYIPVVPEDASSVGKVYPISELTFAPVPANSEVTINYYSTNAGPTKIEIYTMEGKLIQTFYDTHSNSGEHTVTFNTMHIPNGSYACRLSQGNGTATGKIVIQH